MKDLIGPAQVLSLRVPGKPQLLQELARRAAKLLAVEPQGITEALRAREELGSTGIGHGIAVPHARVAGLPRSCSIFVRLEKPIEFDSVDGKPVDLVFLLLSPPDAVKEHLTALARVVRCLRDQKTAGQLRAAADPKALYDLLCAAGS